MHAFTRSPRTTHILLGLVTLAGCTQRSDPAPSGTDRTGSADPAGRPGSAETRVALDVPPGLAVILDGEARGNAPLEPLVVSPGKHTLEVDGPCGKASAPADAAAGALTTVKAEQFAGLKVARLTVVAKKLDGTSLSPTVSLGDWPVLGAVGAQIQIPACKLRLTVASEGLGGFIEDIEFEAGKSYARDVVLAPGPDMVRIQGGHFRMGPPGPDRYDPTFVREEAYEDYEGWPWIKPHEVDVSTFEIDRTEVTAEQFHACYTAGYCSRPVLLGSSTRPPEKPEVCSTDVYETTRDVQGGRAAHPANCVAPWEAVKYCEWVGKRLPTEIEWEFAARSRNSSYACAWGGGFAPKIDCDRSGLATGSGTRGVCSFPGDDTEQGLCDMMGNVTELVTYAATPARPAVADCPYNVVSRGAQWGRYGVMPFMPHRECFGMEQSAGVGFRCARDSREATTRG